MSDMGSNHAKKDALEYFQGDPSLLQPPQNDRIRWAALEMRLLSTINVDRAARQPDSGRSRLESGSGLKIEASKAAEIVNIVDQLVELARNQTEDSAWFADRLVLLGRIFKRLHR